MKDLILYRNEWYNVKEYHARYVVLIDEIGNNFQVKNQDIEILYVGMYYA